MWKGERVVHHCQLPILLGSALHKEKLHVGLVMQYGPWQHYVCRYTHQPSWMLTRWVDHITAMYQRSVSSYPETTLRCSEAPNNRLSVGHTTAGSSMHIEVACVDSGSAVKSATCCTRCMLLSRGVVPNSMNT